MFASKMGNSTKNHYKTTLEERKVGTRAAWPKLSILDSTIFMRVIHFQLFLTPTDRLVPPTQQYSTQILFLSN